MLRHNWETIVVLRLVSNIFIMVFCAAVILKTWRKGTGGEGGDLIVAVTLTIVSRDLKKFGVKRFITSAELTLYRFFKDVH